MNLIETVIVAIVEGLTEFLPISSTAHMKFTAALLGTENNNFTEMFEVVIQLAAILAVVVVYRKKFFAFRRFSFYGKLIIAVVPALIGGLLLHDHISAALGNLYFISWVMIGGGIVLLFIDNIFKNPTIDSEQQISYTKAFIIGCGQVLSILLPGLSRSAATIITGMSQKLTRSEAAEFSFFLAVPTMFAASAKSFYDSYTTDPGVLGGDNALTLGIGSVVAFLTALMAIKFFITFLKKHGFKIWGVYRIVAGATMLLLLRLGIVS